MTRKTRPFHDFHHALESEVDRHIFRTFDCSGFHTLNGSRFWCRPLYGANRRSFVTSGDLPQAAFVWFHPTENAYVRCAHFLPGVITPQGAKWLYEADDIVTTYDPGRLRFRIADRFFEDGIEMELVSSAQGDGYSVRIGSGSDLDFIFVFGGFLFLTDKDEYQGNSTLPGGILSAPFEHGVYSALGGQAVCATVEKIAKVTGEPLAGPLCVCLKSDRPMTISEHEARDGDRLDDFLRRPGRKNSASLCRLNLKAGDRLHLACIIPESGAACGAVASGANPARLFGLGIDRADHISTRVKVHGPNALLDLGMRALCTAMDALWVPPVFLHGPIRWGAQGLCGWRIAYGADVCGDYERTASHCRYYAEHQGKENLDRRPRASPETALTRQAGDSVLFSNGHIVNWGVYNCTELWLNFLAHYYQWTGDREFIRAIWPNIRRAVAYEKRVFDPDGDSLYENYANTYITDAHWHAGSGCVQASSYMYLGNRFAALAAGLVGESPEPFQEEAEQIRRSMNRVLWLADKGVYAQWKDYLGTGLLHTDPELEAIHLPINNDVTDDFQTYQMLRFSEWGLPNDFTHEEGLQSLNEHFYPGRKAFYWVHPPMDAREMLTSNWRPIVNTVCESSAGGESMETARAYYRLGLCDRAWPLIQTMLQQMISRPTAGSIHLRGNVDFGDAVGTTLQAIVEGLFGVHPQMAENIIEIQPGFPSDWNDAGIKLRDCACSFRRDGRTDVFFTSSTKPVVFRLKLRLRGDGAEATVNGMSAQNTRILPGIGASFIEITAPSGQAVEFRVTHSGHPLPSLILPSITARTLHFEARCRNGVIGTVSDPQGLFQNASLQGNVYTAIVQAQPGYHTAFALLKGKHAEFWQPIDVCVREETEILDARMAEDGGNIAFKIRNNAEESRQVAGSVKFLSMNLPVQVEIEGRAESPLFCLPIDAGSVVPPGLHPVRLVKNGIETASAQVDCFSLPMRRSDLRKPDYETVDLAPFLNEDLALIHTREYLKPRSPFCSLQIGSDLYREWCSCGNPPCGPLDLGILKKSLARHNGILMTEPGVPFSVSPTGNNILFVSQWDNYPAQFMVPVNRDAAHIYLLMASVTNPMQSGVVNGRITLNLDGGQETTTLELINPSNLSWCIDNYPSRSGPVHLVKPAVQLGEHTYATIYNLPLDKMARLDSISIEAVCNESVIGMMAVTIVTP